jgi:DegV family protein with EDD domain
MIKIVTDSTAYLEENFIKENGIKVVPLKVSFGEKHFIEGADITTNEFYELLAKSETLPKTSQPSVQDFIDTYKPILEKDNHIISVHISGELSGTVNAANLAKKTLNTEKICVVNSLSTGIILQFLIEKALELIKHGESFKNLCSSVNAQVKKMLSRFILDDLNYMVKGGRLNKTEALIGSILHIRPIVSFTNGKSKVEGISRTWKEAKIKLLAYAEKVNRDLGIEKIGVHCGANIEEGVEFKKRVEEILKISVIMRQVGSVLGTYGGPKWLGLGIQTK